MGYVNENKLCEPEGSALVCVSHVSLVPSRNHHTSPFNAVPLGEQCFMIVVCSTYPQVCLPSFHIVLSLQVQELSQRKRRQ